MTEGEDHHQSQLPGYEVGITRHWLCNHCRRYACSDAVGWSLSSWNKERTHNGRRKTGRGNIPVNNLADNRTTIAVEQILIRTTTLLTHNIQHSICTRERKELIVSAIFALIQVELYPLEVLNRCKFRRTITRGGHVGQDNWLMTQMERYKWGPHYSVTSRTQWLWLVFISVHLTSLICSFSLLWYAQTQTHRCDLTKHGQTWTFDWWQGLS